ncbi:MAG: helix-turn-helix transcriptional regulator [Clostridia bacterium]|nr:helix-turn-helix transcriptional regulator [Clostridia bacterium]
MAKNDLMHGNTSLLVLSLIETQDMYGYQIIKELKRKSENVFELKEGSLYPVLHALENEKLITSYIEETDSARKRRYYSITDKGRKELADKKEEFFTFTNAARKVLTFA